MTANENVNGSSKSAARWATINCTVNGERRTINAPPMKRLLDVLREDLRLTGTKEGCGEGECGSCSVRLNGELVNSCLVPVLQVEGAQIQTVEGLALDGILHPLQKAFLEQGGAQCGICTPGMLMAAAQLLEHTPHPDLAQIREALAGNLCRCTGFMRIFESVIAAAAAAETADPLGALKGHDFSRAVNSAKTTGPLGPEGCPSGVNQEAQPAPPASETTAPTEQNGLEPTPHAR